MAILLLLHFQSALLLLLCFVYASPFPSLISLNCTLQISETIRVNINSSSNNNNYSCNQILIEYDKEGVAKARFITSAIKFGPERSHPLVGVIMRRQNLNPIACTLCAQFDNYKTTDYNYSRSNQTQVTTNGVHRFEQVYEPLLLRLSFENRTMAVSGGDFRYCNHSNKVSINEFVACLGKTIQNISGYCGGEDHGDTVVSVVKGYCVVRYGSFDSSESSRINVNGEGLLDVDDNNSSGVSRVYREDEINGGDGKKGFMVKVVMAWGGGAACCVAFVFFVWLLRRSIINRAKVVAFGNGEEDDDYDVPCS